MHPEARKLAPSARRVCAGRAGGGSYVHTPIATSPVQVFEGSTSEWVETERNKRRFKAIMQTVWALAKCGRQDQAEALMCCGRFFQRTDFPCGSYKLVPYYCNSIFCPRCSARRSRPLQKRILEKLNQTKFDYWHLGVTVKNWPMLTREGLNNLHAQFARLRETAVWKEQVFGGCYSTECTYNGQRQDWHPHLHSMIETKKRLPMDWIFRLRAEWLRITGDSDVLHLEKMYGIDSKGNEKRKVNKKSVRELVKYATKSQDFSGTPELVSDFLNAFENVRRMQSFGSFLGVEEEKPDYIKDPVHVGCKCGLCSWADGHVCDRLVHVSQTILAFDGTRQLRLFDAGHDPPSEVVSASGNNGDAQGTMGPVSAQSFLASLAGERIGSGSLSLLW